MPKITGIYTIYNTVSERLSASKREAARLNGIKGAAARWAKR